MSRLASSRLPPAIVHGATRPTRRRLRFSALLIGVAALGAVLSAATANKVHAASTLWGLDPKLAWEAAKQFAAGDGVGALRGVGSGHHAEAVTALRKAFAGGFSMTAWIASAIGLATCCLTLALLRGDSVQAVGALHVVPGE